MSLSWSLTLLVLYYLTLGVLALYGIHRSWLVVTYLRHRRDRPALPAPPAEWPVVTVQRFGRHPMVRDGEAATRGTDVEGLWRREQTLEAFAGDLLCDGEGFINRDRPLGDPVGERRPLDQFHDEGLIFDSVDRGDIRVIQRRERLRLALEAHEPIGIRREELRQDLERHITVERCVTRPIDLTHASGAEGRNDLVDADTSSCQKGHGTGRIMAREGEKRRRMTGPVTSDSYAARAKERHMARSTEVIRQWEILRAIDGARHGIGIPKLAAEFGVHQRTIRRDLEALCRAGFPLFDDKVNGTSRWRLTDKPFKDLERLGMGLTELCALYISHAMLGTLGGTPLLNDAERAFLKIEKALPPECRRFVDRLPGVVRDQPPDRGLVQFAVAERRDQRRVRPFERVGGESHLAVLSFAEAATVFSSAAPVKAPPSATLVTSIPSESVTPSIAPLATSS